MFLRLMRCVAVLVGGLVLVLGESACSVPTATPGGPGTGPTSEAADKIAIMELANRFENTFDDGDREAHLATLSDDIVFVSDAFGTHTGKDAYRAWVEPFLQQAMASGGTRHLMTNFEIDVDGDRATAVSYLTIFSRATVTPGAVVEFTDELARVDGRWLFTRRTQVVNLAPTPTAGS